jgi:cell division protein FtsI (penicillin-binding protein 3)
MAKLWTPRALFRLGRAVIDRMEPIDPFSADERPDRKLDAAWRPVVKRRALCALAFLAVWAVTLEARLVMLQVVQHDSRLAEAIAQQESEIRPEAPRGDILDREGRLLAYSVDADSIVADPSLIKPSERRKTAEAICDALRDCTRKDRDELVRTLSSPKRFVYVRRSRTVLPDQVARVDALGLTGILLRTEPRRYYPYAELAAHVLGFVGLDNTGQAGVEYSFDQDVRGQAGLARVQVDARGRRLDTVVERPAVPGATVELTIDVNLQYIAERELEAGVEANRARGGTVLIMDPRTGEILAMANYPTFNPNIASRFGPDARRNRAVTDPYEPGSTIKMVTASAALENHIVTPTDLIDTNPGYVTVAGRSRPIYDTHRNGVIPFTDVIVKSSNVGAVKVGLRTGAALMTKYVRLFGFGQQLAPDLPGGSRGLWNANLTESGLASVSMGYQIGVTPVQMVTAASVIANGGMLMEPHVVRAVTRNGVREAVAPKALHRAIEPDTAAELVTMMEGVVERGTATMAKIAGYAIAGKTGTSHRVVDGHYSDSEYNASFVGIVPSRHPVYTILVVIDTPRAGSYYGGTVAGPIFKRIAEAALQHAGVPPTESPEPPVLVPAEPEPMPAQWQRVRVTSLPPQPQSADGPAVMPDLRGVSGREAMRTLGAIGLTPRISGSGFVVRQSPEPGVPVDAGGQAIVELRREAGRATSIEANP